MSIKFVLIALVCIAAFARGQDEDGEFDHSVVTCGSILKLQHMGTGARLHSHSVNYGSGSKQQSVTGLSAADDPGSFWIVRAGFNEKDCAQGAALQKGAAIRLQHMATGRFLHSHRHQSPLSKNQEVSAFGDEGGALSDFGDNWSVELSAKANEWRLNSKIRLRHMATSAYLSTHDVTFGNPIPGQREVFATPKKGKDNIWKAAEGIYFPRINDGKE
jgi:dolichyl-phosphate-mannose--protein O-mannosyl transferase